MAVKFAIRATKSIGHINDSLQETTGQASGSDNTIWLIIFGVVVAICLFLGIYKIYKLCKSDDRHKVPKIIVSFIGIFVIVGVVGVCAWGISNSGNGIVGEWVDYLDDGVTTSLSINSDGTFHSIDTFPKFSAQSENGDFYKDVIFDGYYVHTENKEYNVYLSSSQFTYYSGNSDYYSESDVGGMYIGKFILNNPELLFSCNLYEEDITYTRR